MPKNQNLIIKNLNISFDTKVIYKDFSLEIESEKITVLLAPSGEGKTTLLKAIAKQEKQAGFLFQTPRLLPWKTILENVTIPLENSKLSKNENDIQ